MTKLRLACLPVLAVLTTLPAFGAKVPINGRVVGPGRAPVAGAKVLLVPVVDSFAAGRLEVEGRAEPEPVATGTVDKAGAFQLTAEPGFWKVVVVAEGFVPVEHHLTPLLDAVELPAAELKPDRPLEVRVAGPDGKPVAGARVTAETDRGTSLRSLSPWQAARRLAVTDAEGVARLPRGADEKLTVRVGTPDFPLAERKGVRGGVRLALPAGGVRPLQVRDAAGRGIAGVLVRLRLGGSFWPVGRTDAAGFFGVPAPLTGKVEVHLRSEDGRWAAGHLQPVTPDRKEPQAVVLPPAVTAAGRVVSLADGRPVGGAVVWNEGDPGTFTRTGVDGAYRLPVPPDQPAYLAGTASGFFEETAVVKLGEGRERRAPTLALSPKAGAGGVVVDEKGQGVAGVEVLATPNPGMVRMRPSFALFRSGGVARTSPTGRFRLDSLFPGVGYSLRVTRQGFAPASAEVPPLEPGRPAGELRIVLRTGRTAFGLVQDRNRTPVAGAAVALRPAASADPVARLREARDPGAGFEGTTDGGGRFEMANLPAGTYDLVVRSRGFAPVTVPRLEIPEGAGATDLGTVGLVPGVPVEGRVTDPRGRPIEGAEIRARAAQADPMAAMMARYDPGPADAATAADGTFVLEDRSAGEALDLSASHPDHAAGSAPGVVVPLEEPVRLVLHPIARVAGRVVGPDGRPVPRASVTLQEMVGRSLGGQAMLMAGRFESTEADDEGAFQFPSVAPGPIELGATAPRHQKGELSGIELQAGQDLKGLEILLEPGATVTGRVLAPDGRPVPGAEVSLQTATPSNLFVSPGRSAHTDGDGVYVLDGLPPGPRSLAADAEGYQRTARDLEVRAGDNTLDFTLGRGAEVSGRVVDDAGIPLPGTRLTLRAGLGFTMDAPQAVSGPDGGFRFTGVPDGTYRLLARKPGFAGGEGEAVTVAGGAPVGGLEVKLGGGGTITGRLSGLSFDDLARVRVWASSEFNRGQVDADGVYRIPNLRPGEWRVVAEVPGTARRAEGKVQIEPGAAEARLDLRFGDGFEVSGVVLRNGRPAPGLVVTLGRPTEGAPAWKEADHQGSFRFGGLEAGAYAVSVADAAGGTLHRESLEVDGDRELRIELRTAPVSGRVVDAAGSGPVAGATVSLVPPTETPQAFDPEVRTDSQGAFRFSGVGEGTWKLRATRDGYAPAEREVRTDGTPLDGLELALQPAEGLTLEVALAAGSPPDRVRAAVFAADGRVVAQGSYPVGDGFARLSDVPAGSWQVVVECDQSAPVTVAAVSPGPPVRMVLPPGGGLKVKIPEIDKATYTLTGPDGAPFRVVRWEGLKASWEASGGEIRFERVPAGSWQVTARTPDGRTWSGTATVVPGAEAEVTLQ